MARILIVEDNPQILMLTESILQSAGHETLSAANHDGAVALFENGEQLDLIFLDHNLGEGPTGIEVGVVARRHHPEVRVLYTSGDTMTDGTRAMFVDGGVFLPKPYTPEQLFEAVENLLGQSPEDQ